MASSVSSYCGLKVSIVYPTHSLFHLLFRPSKLEKAIAHFDLGFGIEEFNLGNLGRY